MSNLSAAVAIEVRAHMARQKKTGVQLAKHMGLSQSSASRRLHGDQPFDLAELDVVSEWLGISTMQLLLGSAQSLSQAGAERRTG